MDKIFLVKLERTRAYWDYYKMIFTMLCLACTALIVSTAIFFHAGALSFIAAVGLSALFLLVILLLLAVMSLMIWSFENKHLHDLIADEIEDVQDTPEEEQEYPLV
ncbi:MAG: hypothetical protein ABIH11_00705 [Candidatus Altiarchaeota archaeon]